MKFSRIKISIVAFALLLVASLFSGCAERNPTDTNEDARLTGNSKILVTYFT